MTKSTKNEVSKPRFLYPRRESNPNYKFRKLMFYPLNYKGLPLFYLNYYPLFLVTYRFLVKAFRKLPFYPLNYRTAFMCFSVRLFPRFAHEAEKMRYFEKSPPSYAHLTYSAPHV